MRAHTPPSGATAGAPLEGALQKSLKQPPQSHARGKLRNSIYICVLVFFTYKDYISSACKIGKKSPKKK
jgi:hypothetical protein